jgi:transposase
MKAYSLDLREKIVETYKAGGITQRELAARFRVSLFFIIKLLRVERNGESLQAKRRGANRKPLLNEEMQRFIESELLKENDLTLPELCERVAAKFAVEVSAPTMCRALKKMGFRRKKRLSTPASEKAKESANYV